MKSLELDWDLIWRVERDVCFLYHEQASHAGIDGDLDYGGLYNLPYWDYLNLSVPEMPDKERAFAVGGCLMLILAMAWDMMDGSGSHLKLNLDACEQAVRDMNPQSNDIAELQRTVILALETARRGIRATDEVTWLTIWANRTFIQRYFHTMMATSRAAHERLQT